MPVIDMFEDITSANIATYWTTITQTEQPYLGEVLFPNTTTPDQSVSWYKGVTNAPKPLQMSAFDVQAVPRSRQGFEEVTVKTKFFKESKYIDEQLRQDLIHAQQSAIAAQKDIILGRIYKDETELIRGASLTREIMRMQLLQTGKLLMKGTNGQIYNEDLQMKATHQANARTAWGTTGASPVDDIRDAIDRIGTDEGVTIARAIVNLKTFRVLMQDAEIKATILANNANTGAAFVPQSVVLAFLESELGVRFQVYDKAYVDATGKLQRFIADGNVVFLPAVTLGTTAFSTTPEAAGLGAVSDADVSVVDTGVAITVSHKVDPVTKETKVSQQVFPTFEQIDSVYVLHAFSSTSGNTQVPGGTGSGSKTSEANAEDGKDGATPPEA